MQFLHERSQERRELGNASVPQLTESVSRLVQEFSRLPGIGKKTAERLTYHVLRVSTSEAMALAEAIRNVKENVHYCKVCYNLAREISARSAVIRAATGSCCAWSSNRAT
jgi:hypothetical protein